MCLEENEWQIFRSFPPYLVTQLWSREGLLSRILESLIQVGYPSRFKLNFNSPCSCDHFEMRLTSGSKAISVLKKRFSRATFCLMQDHTKFQRQVQTNFDPKSKCRHFGSNKLYIKRTPLWPNGSLFRSQVQIRDLFNKLPKSLKKSNKKLIPIFPILSDFF